MKIITKASRLHVGPTTEEIERALIVLLSMSPEHFSLIDHPGMAGAFPPFAIMIGRHPRAAEAIKRLYQVERSKGPGLLTL